MYQEIFFKDFYIFNSKFERVVSQILECLMFIYKKKTKPKFLLTTIIKDKN